MYNDYVSNISKQFTSELDKISAFYNFDLGDEFEIAICKLLRKFLPQKYGICRGFIVNKEGNTAGDDIIIYDQIDFPTIRLIDKDDYSKKEQIPVEAVYGYIEAKNNLEISNEGNLKKALDQIKSVKEILLTREQFGLSQTDKYHINKNNTKDIPVNMPSYRNPPFTMIFSRTISEKSQFTELEIYKKELAETMPDSIIFGDKNCFFPIVEKTNNPTHFINKNTKKYTHIKNDISYGIGLIHLIGAIDFIKLGRIPWDEIFNKIKNK